VEAFCRSHDAVGRDDVRVVGHHGHLSGWLKGNKSRSQPRVVGEGQGDNEPATTPRPRTDR
jgi:hypothetical protein